MTRTKIVRVDPFNPSDELLAPCAQALRDGGLVAFPTETVYGLGSNVWTKALWQRSSAKEGLKTTLDRYVSSRVSASSGFERRPVP